MPKKHTRKRGTVSAGEWKPAFLRALANSANVRAACIAAGVTRAVAYVHKREQPAFAKEWAIAMEDACDILEGLARQRASKDSDVLMIFLLKAHRPEKYRENLKVEHVEGVKKEIVEEII